VELGQDPIDLLIFHIEKSYAWNHVRHIPSHDYEFAPQHITFLLRCCRPLPPSHTLVLVASHSRHRKQSLWRRSTASATESIADSRSAAVRRSVGRSKTTVRTQSGVKLWRYSSRPPFPPVSFTHPPPKRHSRESCRCVCGVWTAIGWSLGASSVCGEKLDGVCLWCGAW